MGRSRLRWWALLVASTLIASGCTGNESQVRAGGPDDDDESVDDGSPIVESGATLEVGERRAYPLGVHCGMDRLGEFNDVRWGLVDAPTGENPETGAGDVIPDEWPGRGQIILGFVTLTAEDRIEYSIGDGEVIAVYGPLPADTPEYGCA